MEKIPLLKYVKLIEKDSQKIKKRISATSKR